MLTTFLSSRAVALIVTIFRLMRSGDCTIRERVDDTASESTDISFKIASWDLSVRRDSHKGNKRNDLVPALFGLFLFNLLALLGELVVKLLEH